MTIQEVACISTILFLCLASRCVEAKDPFNAGLALAKAKSVAAGKDDPNVKIFNVLNYGAKADGKSNAAFHFIKTFKAACNFNGNAMMVIPQGEFFSGPTIFQGPCFNPSPVIIKVAGNVKADPDISEYMGGADNTGWITIQNIDGLIITGSGTLDGQGSDLWKNDDCKTNDDCVRMPASLTFNKVSNALIQGITSVNPKGFHILISNSQNFRIFNAHLTAPADSSSTDGIHVMTSTVVKIARSNIATGGDCVSIIQGCKSVSISKVTCGAGGGFSVGGLGHNLHELDVSGFVVRNSTLSNTNAGVKIVTFKASSPSKASGIYFQDIIMDKVMNPILINQEYGNANPQEQSKVAISDVHFINIRGTTTSKVAVNLLCSQTNPCNGIHLRDIDLVYVGLPNPAPYGSKCANVKAGFYGVQNPPPCK